MTSKEQRKLKEQLKRQGKSEVEAQEIVNPTRSNQESHCEL